MNWIWTDMGVVYPEQWEDNFDYVEHDCFSATVTSWWAFLKLQFFKQVYGKLIFIPHTTIYVRLRQFLSGNYIRWFKNGTSFSNALCQKCSDMFYKKSHSASSKYFYLRCILSKQLDFICRNDSCLKVAC